MTSTGDIQLATGLVVVYAFMSVFGFSHAMMTELLLGGWVMYAVLVGLLAVLYSYGFRLSALLSFIVLLRVITEAHGSYATSDSHRMRVYQRQASLDPRFDQVKSIDLAFASGNATFDPPVLLDTASNTKQPLLLFPPTSEQLALIGNNGHM